MPAISSICEPNFCSHHLCQTALYVSQLLFPPLVQTSSVRKPTYVPITCANQLCMSVNFCAHHLCQPALYVSQLLFPSLVISPSPLAPPFHPLLRFSSLFHQYHSLPPLHLHVWLIKRKI
ncbi:hypothetical protein BsWGS_19045 [Bradybaena similaris]